MKDVELIRGDCLKVLPTMADGSVDAVITDPPYLTNGGTSPVFIRTRGDGHKTKTVGMPWGYSLDWVDAVARLRPKQWAVFSNYASLGSLVHRLSQHAQVACIFVWRKSNAPRMIRPVPRLDCEFIVWARAPGASCVRMGQFTSMVIDMPFLPAGVTASERLITKPNGPAVHPCQKPIRLVRPFVERLSDIGETVLDPFAGLATTGIACLQTGRKFIGIEKDTTYFKVAQKRIEAAQNQLLQAA